MKKREIIILIASLVIITLSILVISKKSEEWKVEKIIETLNNQNNELEAVLSIYNYTSDVQNYYNMFGGDEFNPNVKIDDYYEMIDRNYTRFLGNVLSTGKNKDDAIKILKSLTSTSHDEVKELVSEFSVIYNDYFELVDETSTYYQNLNLYNLSNGKKFEYYNEISTYDYEYALSLHNKFRELNEKHRLELEEIGYKAYALGIELENEILDNTQKFFEAKEFYIRNTELETLETVERLEKHVDTYFNIHEEVDYKKLKQDYDKLVSQVDELYLFLDDSTQKAKENIFSDTERLQYLSEYINVIRHTRMFIENNSDYEIELTNVEKEIGYTLDNYKVFDEKFENNEELHIVQITLIKRYIKYEIIQDYVYNARISYY